MRKKVDSDKICSDCGTVLIRGKEECFCDVCKEKIIGKDELRQITVFFENDISEPNHTTHYDVCSWKCVADWLKNIPLNKDRINFITIPYIQSRGKGFTEQLNKFLEALKQ